MALSVVPFKLCPSFPGYSATEDGRVFSHKVKVMLGHPRGCRWDVVESPQHELAQNPDTERRGGYLRVMLCLAGKNRRVAVHRMVLDAFAGPRPATLQGRHLDGVNTNNHSDNLAWGTPLENASDRILHGGYRRGEAHAQAILTNAQREQVRTMRAQGIGVTAIARHCGVGRSCIGNLIYLKEKVHGS